MPTIDLIAGARPNCMKIAPIVKALKAVRETARPLEYRLIHTGQHYDRAMSGSFFEQLGIPEPHHNLGVDSGTQAQQTAGIPTAGFVLTAPLGYLEFNYLVKHALAVITDSGGITEETTVMGVPCLTLRDSTERPETVTLGTNELIGADPANLAPYLERLFAGKWKKGAVPPRWDGKAAERIVECLNKLL